MRSGNGLGEDAAEALNKLKALGRPDDHGVLEEESTEMMLRRFFAVCSSGGCFRTDDELT